MALYGRYIPSFPAYLSISALISGLRKMPETLDLSFYFGFKYSRDSPYSLLSPYTLVNSNCGVFLHS